MKTPLVATVLLICGIPVCLSLAGDDAAKRTNKSSTARRVTVSSNAAQADADKEIRRAAAEFATAFNRGDAKAVAAHWTEDGDYINEDGQRFHGREAIEKQYAAFFAAEKGAEIKFSIDSIRLIGDGTAIEDGRATIGPMPKGPPAHSRYLAVHVKRNGRWLMSSVRDSRVEIPSNHRQLADLEFLIGTWHAEHNGSHVEVKLSWMANKNHIERTHVVRQSGKVTASSKQIIGWDPRQQRPVSWTFASDGGHAVGTWTAHESGWVVESAGVLMDGTQTVGVNILSHVDRNAVSWKSVNRMKGNVRLPDTGEVILKRHTAKGNR